MPRSHRPPYNPQVSSQQRPTVTLTRRSLLLALGIALFVGTILQRDLGPLFIPAVQAAVHDSFVGRADEGIRDYLASTDVRKLQIGTGQFPLEGWLNTDIDPYEDVVFLDATQPFLLEDGSFRYVFSEHVIEHLTLEQGDVMLAESYRILEPGGRIRVSTPDLRRLVGLFEENPGDEALAYIPGKLAWHGWPQRGDAAAVILNLQLREFGHRFVYDEATLTDSLKRAGFDEIRRFPVAESEDPELAGIEKRHGVGIAALNTYETMALEAVKQHR